MTAQSQTAQPGEPPVPPSKSGRGVRIALAISRCWPVSASGSVWKNGTASATDRRVTLEMSRMAP